MQKGKIGVTTENIFPIIKKFLYSDHEIFIRELVSNAVDATQKLKTLANVGEFKGEIKDNKVRVSVDKKKKTITVSDHGIGMDAEEIEKYINQIAFSSAEDFLEKYKDKANAIIGHFGLGFYSSFMVAKQVEILSKSYKEGAKAVKWVCDGSPEYSLEEIEKDEVGTTIVLHIDDDSEEFLEESKINELLTKYCKFLPVEIAFGKEKEWKDNKEVETDNDKIINDPNPLWTKVPAELKDEDYKNFYRQLYPMSDEPLFWIHLNVDYPFNLTGILYFPRIKNNVEVQRNKIQLYSNQVFVTDSVEGIVPEFLTLLHGVIDSPDIPLNVSRSYLQSDSNVKKISSHINKKVADRLGEIFKEDRKQFEEKWDFLKIFMQYGMMTNDKFYERSQKISLFKNVDNNYFTHEEYEKLIKENQTDKHKKLVYLYTTDKDAQYTYIESARAKGYDVLLLDGQLDVHFANHLEQKMKDASFTRVDGDVIDKLIQKDEIKESKLKAEQKEKLSPAFESQAPKSATFFVTYENLSETENPVLLTQSEFMRRMKDMAELSGGMNFYGELPDSYNLVVNTNHPLIEKLSSDLESSIGIEVDQLIKDVKAVETQKAELEKGHKDKKEEEIPQEEKDQLNDLDKKIDELNKQKREKIENYGVQNPIFKQLIDLALLSNNMLKGAELNKFVKRSFELIK